MYRAPRTLIYFALLLLVKMGTATTPLLAEETTAKPPRKTQYAFEGIQIPAASATEPVRESFSFLAALGYVEDGSRAWTKKRQCVSCHTNGSYMLTRPALTSTLGPPPEEARDFFVSELGEWVAKENRDKLREGLTPTQIAYVAAGLATWDRHVTGELSPETETALDLLFDLQSEDGSFSNLTCWPPLESSHFHGATVAAMAAARAPGWLEQIRENNPRLQQRYGKLTAYLGETTPPHDYGRLLLLWVGTHIPKLIDDERKTAIIEMLWQHQQSDGGWSIRSFATPETWGSGNRAEKLRAERNPTGRPPSDGHMTGLTVLVLRQAGVTQKDPRIHRAVQWLKSNQRQSGRWWTRSLNTDKHHFITYSGTCYPLLALARCDALPQKTP